MGLAVAIQTVFITLLHANEGNGLLHNPVKTKPDYHDQSAPSDKDWNWCGVEG